MPKAAPRPCPRPGCGRLIPFGERCPVHPVKDGSFADRRRGSRQSRGYDAEWDRIRKLVMDRDRGLCQPCFKADPQRITLAVAVDHVVAKAVGKLLGWSREQMDEESNLQAICRTCHTAKTGADADEAQRLRTRGNTGRTRACAGPTEGGGGV